MASATVVSLKARPWQSAQLCFEVGGILESLATSGSTKTMIGMTVTAATLPYGGPIKPSPATDPSLLANSADIWSQLQPNYLAALRAEPRRAALDTAVNTRQNAYYARYSSAAMAAINTAAQCYAPGAANGNLAMLQQLQSLSTTQTNQLTTAYNNNQRGWPGYVWPGDSSGVPAVVLNTLSNLKSTTYTTDSSTATPSLTTTTTPNLTTTTSGQSTQYGIEGSDFSNVAIGAIGNSMGDPPPAFGEAGWAFSSPDHSDQMSVQEDASGETSSQTGMTSAVESGQEASTGGAYAVENENIYNYDYTYRVPFVEAQAQNLRAQISLNDQQFSLTLATQNVPQLLTTILPNELNSIDLSVYQLQIGFINTVLLPTIGGTITGVFKYPGDAVRAGEPVIRIEDNSQMLVVARLVYPGPINVYTAASPPAGSQVTISTNLYDTGPAPPPTPPQATLPGKVVAARGAGDDDLWDVVILCTNPIVSGAPVYPIGYTFDYDNTTVTIT